MDRRIFYSRFTWKSTSKCWPWHGCKSKGYGVYGKKHTGAHRIMWSISNEKRIPKGLWIIHSCDNRGCVNPWHLRSGTPKENTNDMMLKMRHRYGFLKGEDSPASKFKLKQVNCIRSLYKSGHYTFVWLDKKFGVSDRAISNIIKNKLWSGENENKRCSKNTYTRRSKSKTDKS